MMTNIRDAEEILSRRRIKRVSDLNFGDLSIFLEVLTFFFASYRSFIKVLFLHLSSSDSAKSQKKLACCWHKQFSVSVDTAFFHLGRRQFWGFPSHQQSLWGHPADSRVSWDWRGLQGIHPISGQCSCHVTCLDQSDVRGLQDEIDEVFKEFWPLIGRDRSRDMNTGLWLDEGFKEFIQPVITPSPASQSMLGYFREVWTSVKLITYMKWNGVAMNV